MMARPFLALLTRHPCYSRDFVSPILVRPVREQLEHDRVIRLLQSRFRRRFDVGINPGAEQNSPVGSGPSAIFPDVVLLSQDRGRKVMAVIEGQEEITSATSSTSPVSRVLLKTWREIDDQEREMLRSTTFADLADRLKDEAEQMYYI